MADRTKSPGSPVYKIIESPIGPLTLVATDAGLRHLIFGAKRPDDGVEAPDHPLLRETEAQLAGYFSGERTTFDVPLDMVGTPFQKAVWALRAEDQVPGKPDEVIARLDALKGDVSDLRVLAQRQFTSLFEREQSLPESRCPNIFVLRPVDTRTWKKRLAGQQVELHLYCQAPGQWHPTREGGRYLIKDATRWLQQVAPYLSGLNKVLKFVMPLVGPWTGGMSAPDYEDLIEKDRELMNALVKKLPEYEKPGDLELTREVDRSAETIHVSGAALRAVRALLDKQDPSHRWGGLELVFTPEGHRLWLCEHHAAEYKV